MHKKDDRYIKEVLSKAYKCLGSLRALRKSVAVKIASVGVSQDRISPKHPLLRWPMTVLKVTYQHEYWLEGWGRSFCVLEELHRAADTVGMLSPSQGQEVDGI